MSLAIALMREHAFEINLVIDELEVRFKVEYKVELMCKKFYFKLISEDTDERLYGYEYIFDEENTDMWNMEECIQKTHAHLGALVYSKKRGEFIVPGELDEVAYRTFKKYTKKKERCCICLEKAIKKTSCGHVCCHKCLAKVSICPVCRMDFNG
uniref:RING-type domain-containing protein n=1 Tax=viral metagenome TaxID=1070528 RepID=A0A6C0HYQ0_9ZZZZ